VHCFSLRNKAREKGKLFTFFSRFIERKAKRENHAWQLKPGIESQIPLSSFDNFAAFNTTSANFCASVSAVGHLNANRLQIRIEAATGFVVSV
jgi:hypothetical protein